MVEGKDKWIVIAGVHRMSPDVAGRLAELLNGRAATGGDQTAVECRCHCDAGLNVVVAGSGSRRSQSARVGESRTSRRRTELAGEGQAIKQHRMSG